MVAGSVGATTSSPTAIKSSFRSVPPASSVSASSPPLASAGKPTFTPQYAMNAAAFVPPSHPYQTQAGMPFGSSMSPMTDASSAAPGSCAILIRKLARNMTEKELRSMFLFAKDFIDSEFIAPETQDDQGYVSALARFKTSSAASEAKAMLDGKPNTATEANMIVEILQGSTSQPQGSRRNTYDGSVNRGPSSSTSSTASSNGAGGARQASRYNGTFQTMERISPTGTTSTLGGVNAQPNGDFPAPETGSHFQNLFSPQSPINNQAERPRVSGKSVINDDSVDDDETGELLKDPVAYAKNGNGTPSNPSTRRQTNSQPPVSRFAGLSLATSNMTSPPTQGFASPRGGMPMQSPTSAGPSASMANLGPNASYQLSAQHFQRPNYPPVNPADQNPPCNTLYVGNLPIDTSEDELKAMFSKQRGYKRLCFRTKQNGPMCFVEFEDVSFATKALNELYGHPLHNSVKGGIRLSFSKNPLGVRTGQPGTVAGLPSPATPHSAIQGMNGLVGGASGQPFATANGPPPGLAAPPGLNSPVSGINNPPMNGLTGPINGSMINGAYSGTFGMAGNGMNGMRGSSMGGGIATAGHGSTMQGVDGGFPEYMMGR